MTDELHEAKPGARLLLTHDGGHGLIDSKGGGSAVKHREAFEPKVDECWRLRRKAPREEHSGLMAAALTLLLALLLAPEIAAQQVDPPSEPAPLARGYRTRALAGGWGHSWLHGWPGHGKAISDIEYVGFYPQMGWLVTNWLELYGEGDVHLYYRPHSAVLGGVVGIGGRHYFLRDRRWTPYYTLGGGMAWTTLDVPEVDRIWNFQVVWGVGVKRITRRGPGLMLEFRNHHISNAGTRGENLGVNAAMVVAGVHWVLR